MHAKKCIALTACEFNDAILVEICICPLRNLFAKGCMCCSTLAVYEKYMAMLDCIEGRVGDIELRLIELVESHTWHFD